MLFMTWLFHAYWLNAFFKTIIFVNQILYEELNSHTRASEIIDRFPFNDILAQSWEKVKLQQVSLPLKNPSSESIKMQKILAWILNRCHQISITLAFYVWPVYPTTHIFSGLCLCNASHTHSMQLLRQKVWWKSGKKMALVWARASQ